MRAIKFRAWHKLNGLMYNVSGLSYNAPGGSLSHICIGSTILQKNLLPLQCFPLHEVELMQFTGVRTYEDVEIYEGDIIEFQLYEPGKRYRREVAFIEGCFMADMATRLSTAMYVKVIGNIYEHSGLLS